MSKPRTAEVQNALGNPDMLASEIHNLWHTWKTARRTWEAQKAEINNYVFATDTKSTSNSQLPWKNTTTLPKLCQIRDNLHANYYSALFPNDKWLSWKPADEESARAEKAKAIESYMRTKITTSDFRETANKLLLDYIDVGNCFADVEYVNETYTDPEGHTVTAYVGPRIMRIDPMNIVFDITAASFKESPKIVRHIVTIGDLHALAENFPSSRDMAEKAIKKLEKDRGSINNGGFAVDDLEQVLGYQKQGFGSLSQYYRSGYIELLEFEGDIYDTYENKFLSHRRIIIADGRYLLINEPIKTWSGKSTKTHAGWRIRPGNLMAMGPLDNIVGIQYRIDHLENLKADVFDFIAFPVIKTRGDVPDFTYQPGERIDVEIEGDVDFMHPDATALNADMQIERLELKMEELAGAPKTAMGFRTPGEKTKYEVQTLMTAASRIFQSKITHWEENFLEPLMNSSLEVARRNLVGTDVVTALDDLDQVEDFLDVTREDITAVGKLEPVGARHYTEKSIAVQELNSFLMSPAAQDQGIRVHFSGQAIAKTFADLLGFEKYGLYKPNISLFEQAETARIANSIQQSLQAEAQTPGLAETEASEAANNQ